MSIIPNLNQYHSFSIDIARRKMMDEKLIFSRNSIAYRFNELGNLEKVEINKPRIAYDPVTLECLGLMICPPATNQLTNTLTMKNIPYVKPYLMKFGDTKNIGGITCLTASPDGVADDQYYIDINLPIKTTGGYFGTSVFFGIPPRSTGTESGPCVISIITLFLNDLGSTSSSITYLVDHFSGETYKYDDSVSGISTVIKCINGLIWFNFFGSSYTAKLNETRIRIAATDYRTIDEAKTGLGGSTVSKFVPPGDGWGFIFGGMQFQKDEPIIVPILTDENSVTVANEKVEIDFDVFKGHCTLNKLSGIIDVGMTSNNSDDSTIFNLLSTTSSDELSLSYTKNYYLKSHTKTVRDSGSYTVGPQTPYIFSRTGFSFANGKLSFTCEGIKPTEKDFVGLRDPDTLLLGAYGDDLGTNSIRGYLRRIRFYNGPMTTDTLMLLTGRDVAPSR